NYLRNIRVLMPGGVCKSDPYKWCRRDADCGSDVAPNTCEPFETNYRKQIFHPAFLDRLKTYSTLRFKDWMATDNSQQKEWKDPPKRGDARWTIKGVPIEIITELANRLSADVWVNTPHLASDDYVTQLAEYLRVNLQAEQKIYVEHSSEIWNGSFEQGKY